MSFLFVAICASMLFNWIFLGMLGIKWKSNLTITSPLGPKVFEERVLVRGEDTLSKIAVIPLDGIIASGETGSLGSSMIEDFKVALEQAETDPHVKAVVLSVDSPGGEITASDVLYEAICRLARHKPVVVYFNSLGASGAYYAACGANWIMCNETTFTGSIGTIIQTLNYRDLFGKIGLQSVVFKSGKFKDMLNGGKEMSPEEQEYIQGLVMQAYDRFVGIVARSRKLDEKSLREGVADGRILSGTDAYASKLVDELGYIEDAYKKAAALAKAPGAEVVQYKKGYSFDKLFDILGESRAAAKFELNLLPQTFHLKPGRVYLLPPSFSL